MTDTPGQPPDAAEPQDPDAEQRLPVPRDEPAVVSRADRFTSAAPIRRVELTPERAAQVVRQSANARWVGFLAVVVVILFVSIYWFYELGLPGGLSQSRLESEIDAQQVTAVERGYNVYEANCARCHGENGEGGIGPILNSQEKLFAHLNEDYLTNILNVGGRYACGDPNSLMPIWSDTRSPARAAQLPPDPRAHLVHPRPERPDVHQARRAPARPAHRPGHRRGRDLQRVGRPALSAGAGRHAVPGLLEGLVRDGVRRAGRQRRADRVRRTGRVRRAERCHGRHHRGRDRLHDADRDRPGRCAVHAPLRQPGRQRPA